jgi:hypothetical protein
MSSCFGMEFGMVRIQGIGVTVEAIWSKWMKDSRIGSIGLVLITNEELM